MHRFQEFDYYYYYCYNVAPATTTHTSVYNIVINAPPQVNRGKSMILARSALEEDYNSLRATNANKLGSASLALSHSLNGFAIWDIDRIKLPVVITARASTFSLSRVLPHISSPRRQCILLLYAVSRAPSGAYLKDWSLFKWDHLRRV